MERDPCFMIMALFAAEVQSIAGVNRRISMGSGCGAPAVKIGTFSHSVYCSVPGPFGGSPSMQHNYGMKSKFQVLGRGGVGRDRGKK